MLFGRHNFRKSMEGEKRNKVRKGGKQGDGYSCGGYSFIKKHNQSHILAGYPQTHDIEKKYL